ncbi:hypothetical protein [uncultured Sphingomonas sp.]|uniref:hypothetical protein n=1 Tax=uncultured Sphingomonas sp. TaxID=158754 RepID=UPI0035C9FE8F
MSAVAAELGALSDTDRRAILNALDATERARVTAAMRQPAARAPEPLAGRHSSWFEALLTATSDAPATAAALAALTEATADTLRKPDPRIPGQTLLQAAGGLFTRPRSR